MQSLLQTRIGGRGERRALAGRLYHSNRQTNTGRSPNTYGKRQEGDGKEMQPPVAAPVSIEHTLRVDAHLL
jgi:hypothetical protein